jgi:putative endonuclease
MKSYYVYIMASPSKALYIGVTNDLLRRVFEHKSGVHKGFTQKYKIHSLVYFDETDDISVAIEREKQMKKWRRAWKIELIQSMNPEWKDLYPEILGSE